jgi:hypothetical protein
MNYLIDYALEWLLPIFSIVITLAIGVIGYLQRSNIYTKTDDSAQRLLIGVESEMSSLPFENKISFETSKLSEYYSQILTQSRISFWFSLLFASIGFTIITWGVVSISTDDLNGSIITIISGTVVDSISALFFIQSKNAQKAMSLFFNKLRMDREVMEALNMCETISNEQLKDSTKVKLALHLAGVSDSSIASNNKTNL